jgi:hypothetical protein
MQLPATISCIHPFAQDAMLALIAIGLAHAVLLRFRTLPGGRTALLVYPAILLLAIWLGWYRVSPLGFSTGRIPLVQGFLVSKSQMAPALIPRRQVVSVRAETPIGIEPVLLPGPTRCIWASTTGGSFDDPNSCDTAYKSAAAAQYDVLKVHVASACGIPAVTREIRISVLPP